jgi:hypothetical protein
MLLKRQEKIIAEYVNNHGQKSAVFYDELPSGVRSALEKIKFTETLWCDTERLIGDLMLKQLRAWQPG